MTSAEQTIEVQIGQDLVSSKENISLLGLEYDNNFSTAPYLRKLAREANTKGTQYNKAPRILYFLAEYK